MRSEVGFLRHVCHWAPKLTNTNSLFLGGGPAPIQPREKGEFPAKPSTGGGWAGLGRGGKSSLGQNPGLVLPSESGLMPKASEAGPGEAQTLGDCWARFIPQSGLLSPWSWGSPLMSRGELNSSKNSQDPISLSNKAFTEHLLIISAIAEAEDTPQTLQTKSPSYSAQVPLGEAMNK